MPYRFLKILLFCAAVLFLTGCSPDQSRTSIPASTATSVPAELQENGAETPIPAVSPVVYDFQPVWEKDYRPLIMVHYMPWYQTAAESGVWGWHWTMNHFDPRQMDAQGRVAIASHFYPLTGPYDSGDYDLLEYQVMLMKISGIDGVIVDWYGFERFWDYGKINASTQKLFLHIKRAGLMFAIMYEDRTVKNMLDNHHPPVKNALEHGQEVMAYLDEKWFVEDAYLKASGRPVLFVFGNPPYFDSDADWQVLFSGLDIQPYLITQDERIVSTAEAGYPWPPMYLSGGKELTRTRLEDYLDEFYSEAQHWDTLVAGAFPGFHDIYKEAEVGPSYGYLDAEDGKTLAYTLQKAAANDPDIIQIVTWNDYGEGTNVEPTIEYGYRYLEMIQQFKANVVGVDFSFSREDLTLPLKIYQLRKHHEGDAQINARLDEAVNAVFAGRLDIARTILGDLE